MSTFKRLLATLALVTMLVAPGIASMQDAPTPEGEPTADVTATPEPTATPAPEPPPVEPAPDPAPAFDVTYLVLAAVSIGALFIIGWQNKTIRDIAPVLLNAPPQWLVSLFLDVINRGFDEAARRAGETPEPLDDEAIRKLREEYQRIVDEARASLPAMQKLVAAEVARQSDATNAPRVYGEPPVYPPHEG